MDRGAYDGGSRISSLPILPHNAEAEESVIANVVHDPGVIPDVLRVLRSPDDFFHDDHREIFRAVLELYAAGETIDTVTVPDRLMRSGHERIGRFGGPFDELMQQPSFTWHAVEHAAIVRDKAVLRGLMEAAEMILREGYANRKPADEVLSEAQARLAGVAVEHLGSGTVTVSDMMAAVLDRMERRQAGEMFGMPTGLADLDSLTDGFQPQELILVGARSSMGKSSIAMQMCEHVSIDWGKPSLFVSLEMNEFSLAERVLIARARVDGHRIRTGERLTDDEMDRLGRARHEIRAGAPIHILERPSRNISQIVSEVRAIKARKGIEFIVVDYIQQIDSDNPKEGEVQALTRISGALKGLARDLSLPVLVLSQLNRGLESREDKCPRMSDLRGSGSLEQDADIILLLHRPEYFDPEDRPGWAQLIIAKNRNGRTGAIELAFLKEFMRFENMAKHYGDAPAPY